MLSPSVPASRDYPRLFQAMSEVVRVLSTDGDEEEALRASFEAAAEGFGARNALLFLCEQLEPLRLKCIHARGKLSREQIRACEGGESVKGVSPSVIRRVITTGQPELIEDPRLNASTAATSSLTGENYSVLCAPILDPATQTVLAVVYFQNSSLRETYGDGDRVWLERYVSTLGHVFGFYFRQQRRERELNQLLQSGERPENAPELLGESSHTQALRRELHEIYIPAIEAERPDPILILGERGTGKDLIAKYIHAYSSRRHRPFLAVSCGEISEDLTASRFFGHRKGSFTGAIADEPGFFRAANGGVLFLDEISDLAPRAQATLLRVLENHTVVPVGETKEIPVDVALLLATNRNLEQAVQEGSIRRDFYDRFRMQTIRLLPLSERPWDIPALLEYFRSYHERRNRKKTLGCTQEALRALISYSWPGNVRELARTCSLLVTHAKPGARIDSALLERCCPDVLRSAPNPKAGSLLWEGALLKDAVRAFERELILSRLERHSGDIKATRESLGLKKTTFHRYLKALRIAPAGLRPSVDRKAREAQAPPPIGTVRSSDR